MTPLAGMGQEEEPSHMGLDEKKLSPLSWLDILGRAVELCQGWYSKESRAQMRSVAGVK